MNIKILLFFLLGAISNVNAQDSKLFIGFNTGGKFANKHYAYRYTGAYNDELPLQFNNQYTYQQVYQALGNKDFYFSEFNELYRYKPAFNLGLIVGYNTSPNLQASIATNFSRLKMLSTYTLEVIDPSNLTTQGQYVTGNILGEESRFNGRFNLDYIFDGDKVRFMLGVSGMFLAWRIEKQIAELNNESVIINLYSLHNPNNNITKKTSGVGWGYGVNTGIQFNINDKFKGQLVYQPYLSKVDYFVTKNQKDLLGSSYQKPKQRLEHDITLRLIWK